VAAVHKLYLQAGEHVVKGRCPEVIRLEVPLVTPVEQGEFAATVLQEPRLLESLPLLCTDASNQSVHVALLQEALPLPNHPASAITAMPTSACGPPSTGFSFKTNAAAKDAAPIIPRRFVQTRSDLPNAGDAGAGGAVVDS